MRRGEIWWASLPEPQGSMPGYRRPVVIVQANEFNLSKIQTIVVAALTTNLRLARAPGNFVVTNHHSGLSKDLTLNVSQIYTIDKGALTELVGELPPKMMQRLNEGLKLVLALS